MPKKKVAVEESPLKAAWERGRETARGDDFYSDSYYLCRSPNPYRHPFEADPARAQAWSDGYTGKPWSEK